MVVDTKILGANNQENSGRMRETRKVITESGKKKPREVKREREPQLLSRKGSGQH